jgi:hypothetical protein
LPICPVGYVFIESLCYGDCPYYTIPANEDPTKCVPAETCANAVDTLVSGVSPLQNDDVYSLVCNKIGFPKDILCPYDYTEWRTGVCFINCPPGMIENGLTCLRKPIDRTSLSPSCQYNYLYFYNGRECILDPLSVLFTIFLILLVVYIFSKGPSIYFPIRHERAEIAK